MIPGKIRPFMVIIYAILSWQFLSFGFSLLAGSTFLLFRGWSVPAIVAMAVSAFTFYVASVVLERLRHSLSAPYF